MSTSSENYSATSGNEPSNTRTNQKSSEAWQMLSQLLPAVDWTEAARANQLAPAVESHTARIDWEEEKETQPDEPLGRRDDIYDTMARVLYRQTNRHLLVTGQKGVGKTATVRELARKAALGEILFLKDCRFIWLDGSDVGPEDSRGCLETILLAASSHPQTIICLDGFATLLKRPMGANNKPLIRAAARRQGVQIIGLLSDWEFNELAASDAEMLELFTRVEIEEPKDELVLKILQQTAHDFEQQYHLIIDESALKRTLSLTSNYLLSECQPAKSIKVLRNCCEDIDYERTQLGVECNSVSTDKVVQIVSDLTGIPEETLTGQGEDADFEEVFKAAVIGQDESIAQVATEMRLIKAGLSDPDKPAAVMLFAGMTGVGKTELAKRIAELYSTSKKLNTYTMGNFTEPHSVSGIIGVPPGYVGHENGGRLINELNSDPYAVFLLDEAEKAHPNVWKPFLNLFDEGWIVDQRGVKAYADRAVFILTTNAGDNAIAQMTKSGKSNEEIVEKVKTTLSKVRQERSGQPVFTPQFLSRMKRTIVFQSLDEEAMIGIARILIERMQSTWLKKREKQIEVPEDLIKFIGREAHTLNEKSGGKEGGRIVRKLISDLIENHIQEQATAQRDEYQASRTIQLGFQPAIESDSDSTVEPKSKPKIIVKYS